MSSRRNSGRTARERRTTTNVTCVCCALRVTSEVDRRYPILTWFCNSLYRAAQSGRFGVFQYEDIFRSVTNIAGQLPCMPYAVLGWAAGLLLGYGALTESDLMPSLYRKEGATDPRSLAGRFEPLATKTLPHFHCQLGELKAVMEGKTLLVAELP